MIIVAKNLIYLTNIYRKGLHMKLYFNIQNAENGFMGLNPCLKRGE